MKMETKLDHIEKGIEALFLWISELKESQKKTDEQLNRTDAQLRKTIEKLEKTGVNLGDLGILQGEIAKELFYRNVKYLFKPLSAI